VDLSHIILFTFGLGLQFIFKYYFYSVQNSLYKTLEDCKHHSQPCLFPEVTIYGAYNA